MLLNQAINKGYLNLNTLIEENKPILKAGTVIEKSVSFSLLQDSIKEYNIDDIIFNLSNSVENKIKSITKELENKYKEDFLGINEIILNQKISVIAYSCVERDNLEQLAHLFSIWTLSKNKSDIKYDDKTNIISLYFLNSVLNFDFSKYDRKLNIGNFIKKANKLSSNRNMLNYFDTLLSK